MKLIELQNALKEKLEAEYDEFEKDLLKKSKKKIVESAFEYVSKGDIITSMCLDFDDCCSLNEREMKALLALVHPLDYLYQEWLDYGFDRLDSYAESNSTAIEKLICYGIGSEQDVKKINKEEIILCQ